MPSFIDRSRIQAYRNCPRLRFLNYHWEGTGLERVRLGLPLINGSFVHSVLAQVLAGTTLDSALSTARAAYTTDIESRGVYAEVDTDFLISEQLAMLEGISRAWIRVCLPTLRADYDVIAIEQEQQWPVGADLVDMVRCDGILRRKADGLLFILEFKTVADISGDWVKSWQHNSQVLANTLAVEHAYQESVEGVLLIGLSKGRRLLDRGTTSPFYGRKTQNSPFCYGYRATVKSTGEPIYETSWSRNAQKVAIWEEMPIEEWLTHFTDEDLAALFVTVPLAPVRREQERWQRQTVAQETAIAEALTFYKSVPDAEKALALDSLFPMNDDHCYRYFGSPCSFEDLCFNAQVESDPLGSGIYQKRTPHHTTELEAV